MAFDVAAEAYGRFMGRFSEPLGAEFIAFAEVAPQDRGLDVGCGPGALTERLVALLGQDRVAAIDPSPPFVAATRRRCPGVEVTLGVAEHLPYPEASFDAVLAQLVVHFMKDPIAGIAEMARVTRPGGTFAACVWDHAGGSGPLAPFWDAVHELDPGAGDESSLAGVREHELLGLFGRAGFAEAEVGKLAVRVGYESFEQWWEPYTLGVGPAGDYLNALSDEHRERLRQRCAERIPDGTFEIRAEAWAVRAHPR
jgi:SAM-dependent methyltransferase